MVIGLLAVFGKNASLGVLAILMLGLYGLNVLYVRKAAGSVRIGDEREMLRLFPGENGELTFTFLNAGKLPVWNADWEVSLLDYDSSTELKAENGSGTVFPSFFLPGKGRIRQTVCCAGKKRGHARPADLTIHIGDFLGLFQVRLTYRGYLQKAVIVFPEPSGFPLPARLAGQAPGAAPAAVSLFEERTKPRGSREYVAGDPFASIAWKETARTRELRTKEFDRVVLQRWILAADLRGRRPGAADPTLAEAVFSQMAHAAMEAEKRGIELEVRLNMRSAARDGHLHIPADHGRAHLAGVLNRLARLPASAPAQTPADMYRSIAENAARGHILLHFGRRGREYDELAALMKRKGVAVIPISPEEKEAAG
ncbi:hypothetical protein AV656_00270 [Bhargavaea cecembensis]|uniref:DUF58 domain-containing protein n=2 Tax=Bhargavaea cecembensis TaxID=394098 RepID=A0A163G601_9BACL|nr:hypothetical protein AV656_00270 [Bhargavaea cecembensis]